MLHIPDHSVCTVDYLHVHWIVCFLKLVVISKDPKKSLLGDSLAVDRTFLLISVGLPVRKGWEMWILASSASQM